MIILVFALIGLIIGAYRGWRKERRLADMLQYGAAHAMAFLLLGLVVWLVLVRMI